MISKIKRNLEIRVNKIAKANVLMQLKQSKENHQVILIDKFNGLVQIEVKSLQNDIKNFLIFIVLLSGSLFLFTWDNNWLWTKYVCFK